MHLSPEAIRWTQDPEFVERMLEPRPMTPRQIVFSLLALLLTVSAIAFIVSDGLKAKQGNQPILITHKSGNCLYWNGQQQHFSILERCKAQ